MTRSRPPATPRPAAKPAPLSGVVIDDANVQTATAQEPEASDADRAKSLRGLADSVHSAEAFWKAAAKFQRLR